MAKNTLYQGQKVRINFKPGDIAVTPKMLHLNGKIAEVANWFAVRKMAVSGEYGSYYYFTLKGVNTEAGIPYSFTREMLEPVEEVANGC